MCKKDCHETFKKCRCGGRIYIFKMANKYWFTGALKTQFLLSKEIFQLNQDNNEKKNESINVAL